MNVLIISQPVLSYSNNMGKTLMAYFSAFPANNVSQFFLRQGEPTNTDVCENYYRFSDLDAVKSILNHKIRGTVFDKTQIVPPVVDEPENIKLDDAYKLGAAHKAWMLLARDTIWKLSNWKNKKLLAWLDSMNPDIIFLAPGDGAFSYRLADEIARYLSKPLAVVCMDDYFINNRNKGELLGGIRQKLFMNVVNKTIQNAAAIFTICDEMNKAYTNLFHKQCVTLHTSADNKSMVLKSDASRVSYIGNLSCGRYKTLLELGRAISEINDDTLTKVIDVYSGSKEAEYISPLKNAPGINFRGAIPAEQVPEVMSESVMVIHTESFDPAMKELVRFSVSTKIAESLMYGPCLLAYGPEGIASIDYLKENNAAYVISRPEDLEKGLEKILTNKELREQIVRNARALALKNHNADVNPRKVRKWLQEVVDKSQNESSTN
jgi:glycosyltransferase involved in cell wall biosynthesis